MGRGQGRVKVYGGCHCLVRICQGVDVGVACQAGCIVDAAVIHSMAMGVRRQRFLPPEEGINTNVVGSKRQPAIANHGAHPRGRRGIAHEARKLGLMVGGMPPEQLQGDASAHNAVAQKLQGVGPKRALGKIQGALGPVGNAGVGEGAQQQRPAAKVGHVPGVENGAQVKNVRVRGLHDLADVDVGYATNAERGAHGGEVTTAGGGGAHRAAAAAGATGTADQRSAS
ncbi:hypothetical protein FGB62_13g220 [Gracilaria domingensis]|nr:hypothetical protein FGB62_13g220 [Gracilaria domingensis]